MTSTSKSEPIEIKVEAKLQEEIADLEAKRRACDDEAFDLQPQVHAALKENPDDPAALRAHDRLIALLSRGTALNFKLTELRSPAEFERRVAAQTYKTERITKMATTAKKGKTNAKDQGFPEVYLGENGNFRPGMDARAKSDLVDAVLGLEPSAAALHAFTEEEAKGLIASRGWQSFVAAKKKIVEAKAAKAAARAAEKEAREKERAEAKAAKAAAKEAEMETPKDGEVAGYIDITTGEFIPAAKPDPKPTPRKRTRKTA